MRTNDLKHMAELSQDEYNQARADAYNEWLAGDQTEVFDFMDIFTYVGMEAMTAQEDYNNYRRDEGII